MIYNSTNSVPTLIDLRNVSRLIVVFTCACCLLLSTIKLEYITGIKFNYLPIQIILSIVAILLIFKIEKVNPVYLSAFMIFFLLLGVRNLYQPVAIIANPLIPSMGIMALMAAADFKVRNLELSGLSLWFYFLMLAFLQLSLNINFDPGESASGRFKGLGSGTLYSLGAGFFILYLIGLFNRGGIFFGQLMFFLVVPIWTLLLTQSRGVFLSVLLIVIFSYVTPLRGFIALSGLLLPVVLYVIFYTEAAQYIGLLSRLDPSAYATLADMTSGRSHTQILIVDRLLNVESSDAFFFGPGQLNGIKDLVSSGLEFPHLDLLYVAYDGGVIAIFSYTLLALLIFSKYRFSPYICLFFLTTLHTNMILSPMFLVLACILSAHAAACYEKNKSTTVPEIRF